MKRLIHCVFLLAIAVPLVAEKPPWLWTTEERAQAMLDPVQRAARIREHHDRLAARGHRAEKSSESSNFGDVIDGNAHPELFFATELFESLVRSSFVTLPRVYPRVVQKYTSDLFKTPGEWEDFTGIVNDFAVLLASEKYLLEVLSAADSAERGRIESQLASLRERKCPAMATAIRQSREAFGHERFDRMLYEVMTPGKGVTFKGDSSNYVEIAVWREENCQ